MHKLYDSIKSRVNTLTIYQKLVCCIIVIIIIPFSTLYYISEKTSSTIIIEQVCNDTLNSIELASNSIDGLYKRILSTALYINKDANIAKLFDEDEETKTQNNYNDKLRAYLQFSKMEKMIGNLSYITIGNKNYMSFITSDGKLYTNWSYDSDKSNWFKKNYAKYNLDQSVDFILWLGLEENYVSEEKNQYPYVFTIITSVPNSIQNNLIGTFVISVPEQEFINLISKNSQSEGRFLIDKYGKIMSSTKKELLSKTFKDVYNIEIPSYGKGYKVFKYKGSKSILTYYKMESVDWQVVDIKSYKDITKRQIQNRNRLLLITVLCIFIFLIILLFLARSITLPLKKLAGAMLSTDFIYRRDGAQEKRKDEIGILQQSFEIMKVNINNLIQENKMKEKKKRDAELKAMQAQISPHFLFNTLNTIRWAAINKNTNKAADMVLALSKLLHMTIAKGDEMITLTQEAENLINYVNILKMRHSKPFDIVLNICDEIKNYKIPKLLLQPLVENAIIHGFEGAKSGGIIHVKGSIENERVVICIKDNGKGIDQNILVEVQNSKELKFSGIGVSNVDERIKLYYGEEYGLNIYSIPGEGTSVSIILPLQIKEDHEID